MSEHLLIENFGPIVSARLDLKPFMVLIGPQASGKSTIAKLLAIFRNIETYGQQDELTVANMIKYFQLYGIGDYFNNGKTKLSYTDGNYKISYENSTWKLWKSETFQAELIRQKELAESFLLAFMESNERLKGIADKEGTLNRLYDSNWKNLFQVNNEQIYIPAERILVSTISQAAFSLRNASIPGGLQEFGTKFEFATKRIKEYPIEHLGIKYVYDEEKGHRILINNETKSIALHESSSGIQALIPLQIVIDYITEFGGTTRHTFLVEEPELNLFPKTQASVINYLARKYNAIGTDFISTDDSNSSRKNHFVIATHSPYILSVVNNLLLATQTANKNDGNGEIINSVIPRELWLNPEEFNAYSIGDGTATQIFDKEIGLISTNYLDNISIEINEEGQFLMDLYKRSNRNRS